MQNSTLKKEEQILSEAISPRSIELSRQARETASALRDKTDATPYAADTIILANQVGRLCDYVEQLHGNVENLLARTGADPNSSNTPDDRDVTAEDKKAIEIQRETHELHPTVMDTVKALFMWRDSPEERLRDDK